MDRPFPKYLAFSGIYSYKGTETSQEIAEFYDYFMISDPNLGIDTCLNIFKEITNFRENNPYTGREYVLTKLLCRIISLHSTIGPCLKRGQGIISDRCYLDDMVESCFYMKMSFQDWWSLAMLSGSLDIIPSVVIYIDDTKSEDNVYDLQKINMGKKYLDAIRFVKTRTKKHPIIIIDPSEISFNSIINKIGEFTNE